MPEGPQVHRAAGMIAEFAGSRITVIKHPPSRPPWPLSLPARIQKVGAKGKNIFIYLETGPVIYNHMLMWGGWRKGCEVAGKKRLNTCFTTESGLLGYFGGGILKLVTPEEAEKLQDQLGVDITTTARAQPGIAAWKQQAAPIGEVLLNQKVVCGIGNIYKSEGLFVAKINPLEPASSIAKAKLEKLYGFLHQQMAGDVKTGTIITTTPAAARAGNRRFVYRRHHQPCLFCGTLIERIYQGEPLRRSTYYCPSCQRIKP